MDYIRTKGIEAPEGGLALPLPYTVYERPTYSVVPSNALGRDPAPAAKANEQTGEDDQRLIGGQARVRQWVSGDCR